jgi:outer membrane receptor protein involved in Fe transport
MRLTLLLLASVLTCGCTDTTNLSDLKPSSKKLVCPDSDDGFQSFIRDLVHAHAREIGVQSRMHDLLIPNDPAWFVEVFGPANGPVLDFQYRNQLRWQFSRLYTYLPMYGQGHNLLVGIDYSEPGHLSNLVADSELIPSVKGRLKIYSASIATNEEGPWLEVGSFVYVDGNFRYLGTLTITPDWRQFYAYYDKPFEP